MVSLEIQLVSGTRATDHSASWDEVVRVGADAGTDVAHGSADASVDGHVNGRATGHVQDARNADGPDGRHGCALHVQDDPSVPRAPVDRCVFGRPACAAFQALQRIQDLQLQWRDDSAAWSSSVASW